MSINVSLVIILVFLACMAVKGYRNGLIQEIISVVALGVAIIALSLVASAIGNYINKSFGDMILAILFFIVLMLIANISKIIVIPVKFLSKLPIISWVNKLTGMCLSLLIGVIVIWFVFIVAGMFGFWGISQYFMDNIKNNDFLTFLYQNNYLTKLF